MAVTFFLDFPASRIVRNRFLVFKEPVCGTLLQQPKQINSPCGYLTVPASSQSQDSLGHPYGQKNTGLAPSAMACYFSLVYSTFWLSTHARCWAEPQFPYWYNVMQVRMHLLSTEHPLSAGTALCDIMYILINPLSSQGSGFNVRQLGEVTSWERNSQDLGL